MAQPHGILLLRSVPGEFPAPRLDGVHDDRERLIDLAVVFASLDWDYTRAVLDALSAITVTPTEKQTLLTSLRRRTAESQRDSVPNSYIESGALTVGAYCLGSFAADWIRERWDLSSLRIESFHALAVATQKCLPFEEAWERVASQVARWPHEIYALNAFRTPRALDWMEANRIGALMEPWGITAVVSHFTWPRAQAWLESGKPLSHVALAAIHACHRYNTSLTQEL